MRVIIEDSNIRNEFFQLIRLNSGKTWKELGDEFYIKRQMFDCYKSGKTSIPEDLFNKLIFFLNKNNQSRFNNLVLKVGDHLGQIKGGKSAYRKNILAFDLGRKKGIEAIRKYHLQGLSKMKVDLSKVVLTEGLCEFVGAFIGDGFFNSYNNRTYQIEFAGDSRYDLPYYQNVIIPVVKSVFPEIRAHILKVKNKNSIRIVFYSKALFLLLKDYFGFTPGVKTHTVLIPSRILSSGNEDFVNSTIRGIFDTDGCVFFDRRKGYKKPYPRICLQMCSKGLIGQIYDHLAKDFNMSKKENKLRKIGILEVYGHNQLKKWMSLVGFSNKRHLDRIACVA
ncbi:hypothetical protein CMI41_00425 [Candidatus Pacearchaeota archaeon]|nr:hypothetical protein [Candidatus Pacearchaeota archaeon]|tara:strand:- start:7866 stop:8873 length:1008 start_codon:yes stop_codon:yes gene_type:complete